MHEQDRDMKGVIFYYSNTGNTELVCKFLSEKVKCTKLEMTNIIGCTSTDVSNYDIIGFAFPTHYLGIPEAMRKFIESIRCTQLKPVFLINTYGMMQGKALKIVNDILNKKGFRVISWHGLMMPESFPPFIAKGFTSNDKPDEKQLRDFNTFISELSIKLDDIIKGTVPKKVKVKIGFFNSLMGVKSKDSILKEMGQIKFDSSLCTQCGTCVKNCNYHAISMKENPVFDSKLCSGCWSCFNHCPNGSIYTERIKSSNRYKIPQRDIFFRLNQDENN